MRLFRSLLGVSGATMVSRVLGLARDASMAFVFGAGPLTDAFFTAFKLPNMLRRFFAEGAFSQALVPMLARSYQAEGAQGLRRVSSKIAGVWLLVLSVVVVLGVAAAPALVYALAPGFWRDPALSSLTVELLRWTMPYIGLIAMVALYAAVLNTSGVFVIPALAPVWLNLSLIAATWLAFARHNTAIEWLAMAVVVGGLLQWLFVAYTAKRRQLWQRPVLQLRDSHVSELFTKMPKALLGVSLTQVSLLINTVIASFLPFGSVSWLYYADRIMEFPSGLLGVSLGIILLPSMSEHWHRDHHGQYASLIEWGLRQCVVWAIPATLAMVLLGGPILMCLFGYGRFGLSDIHATELAVWGYAMGLVGIIAIKVLAPACYAQNDYNTPIKAVAIGFAATQITNLVSVSWLGHGGLALAISMGALANAAYLLQHLIRQGHDIVPRTWWKWLKKILLAWLVIAAMMLAARYAIDWWQQSWFIRCMYLGIVVIAIGVSYVLMLKWLKISLEKKIHHITAP